MGEKQIQEERIQIEKTSWEPLTKRHSMLVTKAFGFTTDTVLLAHFANPRRNERSVDFGCGCGTIPMLWRIRYDVQESHGIELQEDACKLALESVSKNDFDSFIKIHHHDVREIRKLFPNQSVDLVSCNPPYKSEGTGIKSEDSRRRIARHEETLTFEQVVISAASILKHGGRLCLCQRPERMTDVLHLLRLYGLEPKRMRLVQGRLSKPPSLFLLEAKKGGKSGLVVEPSLIISDEGGFTQEMRRIYGDYSVNTGQDLGRRPNLQAFWEKFDPKPNLKRFFVSFFLKKRKGFAPCSSYHELTR